MVSVEAWCFPQNLFKRVYSIFARGILMTAPASLESVQDWTTRLIAICLQKKGAYIDHPFGLDSTIIKVEGRIFAQFFQLRGQACVTLNCDRMSGDFYRQLYEGIVVRGYHCPPVQQPYFNTMPLSGQVPYDTVLKMIEHSYTTVVGKLPKYKQKRLLEQNSSF